MAWVSTQQRLPPPFTKVWVMTDSGRRTTAYVKSNGDWFVFCPKIAAEKPEIVRWEEA